MNSAQSIFVLIFLLGLSTLRPVWLNPISPSLSQAAASAVWNRPVENSTPTPRPRVVTPNLNDGDYVNERQFQELLARLQRETADSVQLNPANYVRDDADIETILELIAASEELSTTTESSTQSLSGQTSGGGQSSAQMRPPFVNEGPEECPICYEPLSHEPIRTTSCNHKFHRACLDKWTRDVSSSIIGMKIFH